MNRKFFTLMAAALLMGAPMSQTFAAEEGPTYASFSNDVDHELANGIKFMLATVTTGGDEETVSAPIKVASVKIGSKTYYTYAASDGVDAVFEVCNFSSNAVAATFQLKVNGKLFAMKESESAAAAITDSDAAGDVVTTFTVDADENGEYLLESIKAVKLVSAGKPAMKVSEKALVPVTENKPYDAAELLSFNSKGVTLNFGTADVEGNIFSALYPVTVKTAIDGAFGVGTYLVKGTESNIKAFKNAVAPESGSADANAAKAAAKKLSFAAVTTEDWELNTSAAAEGYKLKMVSGSVFYAEEDNLPFGNAAFTINEYDKLNCQGKLAMSATVTVSDEEVGIDVIIAAVKTSKTDTKTYVTTINATEDERTQFKYITLPQLGSNTYFAASEFLKKDAISAYNILFTSGTAQGAGKEPEEKGRYLSAVVNSDEEYELHATTPDSTIVNGPAAQWIATGFDGEYTLTLANRETHEELVLQLRATKNAKEYAIGAAKYDSDENAEVANVKADSDGHRWLKDRKIKLVPATLTQNDGYAVLTDEEQEGTFTLSFTGTNTLVGSRTYYLAPDATTPTKFVAKLDGDASLSIKRVDDSEGNLIELEGCAYLNADGDVLTDAVDSLYVPLYNLTYGDYKVYEKAAASPNPAVVLALDKTENAEYSDYFFKKHLSGNYAMAAFCGDYNVAAADANAISINTEDEPLVFKNEGVLLNNLKKGDFAYVALEADDANDYATLEAVSRHATLENSLGAVSMQENKNGILEGILSVEPLTFWLDTADSEKTTPAFYISVGTGNNEDEVVTKAYNDEVRLFLFNPKDSATVYNEGSATISTDKKYILEGANLKAIFRPAALVAEDTLETVVDGELVTVVTKDADATKDQVNGLTSFQFGIALADEDVEGEYVVKSKSQKTYLYSLNGKLGFTATKSSAMVFTLGEGDATANEAIEAAGVQVIGGQGVVTVQGAAGKVITVANILGQTIANQVAASDNVTIAVPAGIVVVAVEGEATKVVVK